jgi:hypothetical protein
VIFFFVQQISAEPGLVIGCIKPFLYPAVISRDVLGKRTKLLENFIFIRGCGSYFF